MFILCTFQISRNILVPLYTNGLKLELQSVAHCTTINKRIEKHMQNVHFHIPLIIMTKKQQFLLDIL